MELRLWLLPALVMVILHTVDARQIRSAADVTMVDLCEKSERIVNNIECYCKNTFVGTKPFVFKAECGIDNEHIPEDDEIWKAFTSISTIESIIIDPKKNKMLTYIPTQAFKVLRYLLKATIQHGQIDTVHAFAFANLTSIQDIKLSGNGIKFLAVNAFAHHPSLTTLTMDNNNIEEIKRNAFRRLPRLEHLYLTGNKISTIHDRAFSHLGALKSLELDKNSIFVLTNETFTGLINLTTLQLSHNHIEVIGDNTFHMLKNLRTLNLDSNKIRLLDDGALRGIAKLETLLLSNNKLKQLTSSRIFSGLPLLVVLDVRSNEMQEFSANAIQPILKNFYNTGSSIDVDENVFSCDCNLNWFLNIRNNTKNSLLQEKIDNIMCYPSENLAEEHKTYIESEKSKSAEEKKSTAADYEYYDESNMDGKLFFSDIPRHLVPCDHPAPTFAHPLVTTLIPETISTKIFTTTTEPTTTTTTSDSTTQATVVTEKPIAIPTRRTEITIPEEAIKVPTSVVTTIADQIPNVFRPRTSVVPTYTTPVYTYGKGQASLYTQAKTPEVVTDYAPPKTTNKDNAYRTEYLASLHAIHNPLMKVVVPTEDMVSDGNGDSTITNTGTLEDIVDWEKNKFSNYENNISTKEDIIKASVVKSRVHPLKIDDKVTISGNRKSPETMSHIHHASSANKISAMLIITIPIGIFISLHFKL